MTDEAFDAVVVGGGGMGSSAAYFLKSMGGPRFRVAVVEPDPTYAKASTTLAAGGIRQQFSTPENVAMSQFGYQFLEQIGELLAVGGDKPDAGLKVLPYVRLATADNVHALDEQCAAQRRLGAGTRLVTPEELGRVYPWMSMEGVAAASVGGAGEGQFDPHGMLQAFRRKAVSIGVKYLAASVVGMELNQVGDGVAAVWLSNGVSIACGSVFNAAGARAAKVASFAGIDLPVVAIKAHSFAFRAADPVEDCPILLDQVMGLQLKPEGPIFVCGLPRAERSGEAREDDFDIDPYLFEGEVWPRLAARVPQFDRLRLIRGWVGHVELNTLDGNPVIGPHPELKNLYFLNGFSGHGVQHAPAAGRGIAELALTGRFQSLDLSRFCYERIVRRQPVPELA